MKKDYFRKLAIDIINQQIYYTCDNVIDLARRYKALEYLQKRAVREDKSNFLSKAIIFEQNYAQYTEEDIKRNLGRKWKQNLISLKKFADSVKWRFEYDYLAPIGTYEDNLISKFGHMNICNYLKYSQKIGLFNRISDCYDKDNNISYIYSFNESIYNKINIILNQLNQNKINNNNQNKTNNKNISYREKIRFDDSNLMIGSDLSGINVNDVSDEEIVEALNQKYSQAKYYMDVAAELNKDLCDEEKIIFNWNIVRSCRKNEMLKKIGIRACTKMCNYKKISKKYDSVTYKGKFREDYLDKKFGAGNWTSFDFKSSIWQLTYFLNKGIWLNNEVDLYNEIYKKCINEEGYKTKKERNLFKLFGNLEYFDNPNMLAIHTVSKIYNTINWLKGYYGLSKYEINEYYDFKNKAGSKQMYDEDLKTVKQIFADVKKGIEDVVGKLYGTEIFLHESCVYMELFKQLKQSGIDLVQVFDGFYFNNKDKSRVIQIINHKFKDILINYRNNYKISIQDKSIQNNSNKNISYREKIRFDDSSLVNNKDEKLFAAAEKIYDLIKQSYKNALIGAITAKKLTQELNYNFSTAGFVRTWRQNNQQIVENLTNLINQLNRKKKDYEKKLCENIRN